MRLAIRELKTGKIYTNDMSRINGIIEIHFCSSYTQVVVQDIIAIGGEATSSARDLFLKPFGNPNYDGSWDVAIDHMALPDGITAEWIKEKENE